MTDLHPAIASQENILRLQVSMDDPFGVRGRQPARDRCSNFDRLAPRQRAPFQAPAQRLAFQQLHNSEEEASILPEIMNCQNVWV